MRRDDDAAMAVVSNVLGRRKCDVVRYLKYRVRWMGCNT